MAGEDTPRDRRGSGPGGENEINEWLAAGQPLQPPVEHSPGSLDSLAEATRRLEQARQRMERDNRERQRPAKLPDVFYEPIGHDTEGWLARLRRLRDRRRREDR
jgi:hypothetical protein